MKYKRLLLAVVLNASVKELVVIILPFPQYLWNISFRDTQEAETDPALRERAVPWTTFSS